VFNTDADYRRLFPKLFDQKAYTTDPDLNAGMTFENNPSFKGNLMRIAVKLFETDNKGEFEPLNMKHEFVHYLDMRYNWASAGTEPNDWWMEGLAQYIGNSDDEKDALKAVKKNKFTLKSIMNEDNEDNSNEKASSKKYDGGMMVITFMFDKHITDMEFFLDIIRNGEYDEKYDKWRKESSNKYNTEFSKWIVSKKN
jgi:Collagenase